MIKWSPRYHHRSHTCEENRKAIGGFGGVTTDGPPSAQLFQFHALGLMAKIVGFCAPPHNPPLAPIHLGNPRFATDWTVLEVKLARIHCEHFKLIIRVILLTSTN